MTLKQTIRFISKLIGLTFYDLISSVFEEFSYFDMVNFMFFCFFGKIIFQFICAFRNIFV